VTADVAMRLVDTQPEELIRRQLDMHDQMQVLRNPLLRRLHFAAHTETLRQVPEGNRLVGASVGLSK
jgi:hypothetical protein